MSNFDTALKFTGLAEGGYTKLPGDKGGATNYGISDARDGTTDGMVCGVPTPAQGATLCAPVAKLTKAQADAIYARDYWAPICGDKLQLPVAVATFDFAVNSGVSRAVKALQRACGVAQDGVMGPYTISKAVAIDAHKLAAAVCDIRSEFLTNSTDGTIVRYRASLLARVARCKAYCQSL